MIFIIIIILTYKNNKNNEIVKIIEKEYFFYFFSKYKKKIIVKNKVTTKKIEWRIDLNFIENVDVNNLKCFKYRKNFTKILVEILVEHKLILKN